MKITPIRTEADHARALATIERLWNAAPNTPEADHLEVLATLVDAFERQRVAILPPDPVEAIKFRMEQQGQSRKDLEPLLGTRARVSEVLSGRRSLSLAMIRKVHRVLHIPLETLVAERRPRARKKVRVRAPHRARPA
jgi:HTH-type transcriptional regulator / antitoxin HigA